MNKILLLLSIACTMVSCGIDDTADLQTPQLKKKSKEELGKQIFFDQKLSNPVGQSCGSCHSKNSGFSDPDHPIVSEGAVAHLFGSRNAPSIAYMVFSPIRQYNYDDSTYVGGFFLDGRANTLQDQARQPFFNKVEMNLTDVKMLADKIKSAPYYKDLVLVYGEHNSDQQILDLVVDALAAYERSSDLSPFTSKYDYYLKGEALLSAQELRGLTLFTDTLKGKCANCHITDADENAGQALFTDFSYDNIGIPKNPLNPFYTMSSAYNPAGAAYIDLGLGGPLNRPEENGKFKVPTLRNIAITAPYFHNGVYNTLEEVVHFYNKRDVDVFPDPEVKQTVNKDELGDLKLSDQEEKDLVAFLKTLTDGYK